MMLSTQYEPGKEISTWMETPSKYQRHIGKSHAEDIPEKKINVQKGPRLFLTITSSSNWVG